MPAGAKATVRLPDHSQVPASSDRARFKQTRLPGIYEIADGQPLRRFAVNLDPAESRTSPLPVEELERMGVPIGHASSASVQAAARREALQNAELESRQKIWRWLVVATLLVVLGETWLGGRMGRNLQTQT
jgi:hypothetical protein